MSTSGPFTVTSDTRLEFLWTPAANDGLTRNITATFTTSGTPAQFNITLTGSTIFTAGFTPTAEWYRQYILGEIEPPEDLTPADLTGDGEVDIQDFIRFLLD